MRRRITPESGHAGGAAAFLAKRSSHLEVAEHSCVAIALAHSAPPRAGKHSCGAAAASPIREAEHASAAIQSALLPLVRTSNAMDLGAGSCSHRGSMRDLRLAKSETYRAGWRKFCPCLSTGTVRCAPIDHSSSWPNRSRLSAGDAGHECQARDVPLGRGPGSRVRPSPPILGCRGTPAPPALAGDRPRSSGG